MMVSIKQRLVTITEVRTHTQATSATRIVISLILPQIAFGFILSSFYANVRLSLKKPFLDKKPETTSEIDYSKRVSRRVFLRAAIATIIALPILYLGLNRLFLQHEVQVPPPSSSPLLLPQQSITRPLGFKDPRLTPLLDSK